MEGDLEEGNYITDSLMGPAEVGKYLGVGERTIHLWAQQGKIPAFKAGSVWRFRRTELDKWLESTRSGPRLDDVTPITPHTEPPRSKWRIRQDEDQAEQAIIDACKAYIETTLNTPGREVFFVGQFEERFGEDVVERVINQLKRDKKITEHEQKGLSEETVKVIKERR